MALMECVGDVCMDLEASIVHAYGMCDGMCVAIKA